MKLVVFERTNVSVPFVRTLSVKQSTLPIGLTISYLTSVDEFTIDIDFHGSVTIRYPIGPGTLVVIYKGAEIYAFTLPIGKTVGNFSSVLNCVSLSIGESEVFYICKKKCIVLSIRFKTQSVKLE